MNDHETPSFLAGLPLARRALDLADRFHRGQRRDSDGAAFIIHPLEVAALLHHSGHSEVAVAAGILHDAVENTSAEVSDVADQVSPDVAALVEAMTENSAIDEFGARKADLRDRIARLGPDATAVYAADKVSKVRELRALVTAPAPSGLDEATAHQKLHHYVESLHMLEAHASEDPLVRHLRFELEMLRVLPPVGAERIVSS
jgi:(p)ppGpp synthase/HD superfamily hydrolase